MGGEAAETMRSGAGGPTVESVREAEGVKSQDSQEGVEQQPAKRRRQERVEVDMQLCKQGKGRVRKQAGGGKNHNDVEVTGGRRAQRAKKDIETHKTGSTATGTRGAKASSTSQAQGNTEAKVAQARAQPQARTRTAPARMKSAAPRLGEEEVEAHAVTVPEWYWVDIAKASAPEISRRAVIHKMYAPPPLALFLFLTHSRAPRCASTGRMRDMPPSSSSSCCSCFSFPFDRLQQERGNLRLQGT